MNPGKQEPYHPALTVAEHATLWARIRNFVFDEPDTHFRFADKLARNHSWTLAFTEQVIAEYRKFILLCCILPQGASPPPAVDEAWHLHLTYTKNYWEDFCRDTLGRPLHHHPSKGGPEEADRHRAWYRQTYDSYREVFGETPPAAIWPVPSSAVEIQATGPQPIRVRGVIHWLLLLLPPAIILPLYGTLNPFRLNGPHFLLFYGLLALAALVAIWWYKAQVAQKLQQVISGLPLPEDLTLFHISFLMDGPHRCTQLCLVQLIKHQEIQVTADHSFRFTPVPVPVPELLNNPLYQPLNQLVRKDETFSYATAYDLLRKAFRQHAYLQQPPVLFPEIDTAKVIAGLAIGIGILRVIQGIINGKPVIFLILLLVLFFGLLQQIFKAYQQTSLAAREVAKAYGHQLTERCEDPQLRDYYLQGAAAIAFLPGFTAAAMLFSGYRDVPQDTSGSISLGGGSSGSSCGGGCGGGCGGCGGCGGS